MPTDQQSEIPAPNRAPTLGVPTELVLDARAELAEGPLWDVERRVLWWVDINAGRVHRFDPATGSDSVIEIGRAVGCVALRLDAALVVAAAEALLTLNPETGAAEILARFEPGPVALRCNDGKCDPQGRFWIDRLALDRAVGASSLVRYGGPGPEVASRFETVLRGLTIPNGLDWSADGKRMFFVDSPSRVISVFDFDERIGGIGGGRSFVRVDDSLGLPASAVPDGLTLDSEDCVWVAVWGGGCVLRFAPDGSLLDRIDVPVARVSSCAFGGADLTDLFITTAWEGATPDELAAEPAAGGIYRARPGVRGRSARRFRQGSMT
jgi:sugar lactone lactonase YvrE